MKYPESNKPGLRPLVVGMKMLMNTNESGQHAAKSLVPGRKLALALLAGMWSAMALPAYADSAPDVIADGSGAIVLASANDSVAATNVSANAESASANGAATPTHAADTAPVAIAANDDAANLAEARKNAANEDAKTDTNNDSGDDGSGAPAVSDPFEKVNRFTFILNDKLDRNVLQPVARTYNKVVPDPAKNCIGHFFGNMADVRTAINEVLQGKLYNAESDICRVAVNTTVGILGCFDVASKMGMEKHKKDFSQTLALWGVPSGPYVVIPLFGPSTLTDAVAEFTVDNKTDLIYRITPVGARNTAGIVRLVDKRASLLDAGNLVNGAALDQYLFIRDAFIARRRSLIYDGNPPEDRKMSHSSSDESGSDAPAVSMGEGSAAVCTTSKDSGHSSDTVATTPDCGPATGVTPATTPATTSTNQAATAPGNPPLAAN